MGPVSQSRGILFAILMASLPGCMSTTMPATEGEGERIDDTFIPNRLKAAVVDEPLPTCLANLLAASGAEIPHA